MIQSVQFHLINFAKGLTIKLFNTYFSLKASFVENAGNFFMSDHIMTSNIRESLHFDH